jgi:hypothetical protein
MGEMALAAGEEADNKKGVSAGCRNAFSTNAMHQGKG